MLDLQSNHLSGALPGSIGDLLLLEVLHLGNNHIRGKSTRIAALYAQFSQ